MPSNRGSIFHRPSLVGGWILLRQALADHAQLGPRLGCRHTLAQAAHHQIVVRSAVGELRRVRRQGEIQVGHRRIADRLGHHADHRVALLVQLDIVAHHIGVGVEMLPPEAVAQNGHALAARLGLARLEDAT
jgi:hypothetical protein